MSKDFEEVKNRLAEHLMRIDLDKLSMMDLSSYVGMVCQLNPLYDKKPDYYEKMSEWLKLNMCIGQKAPAIPLKEV